MIRVWCSNIKICIVHCPLSAPYLNIYMRGHDLLDGTLVPSSLGSLHGCYSLCWGKLYVFMCSLICECHGRRSDDLKIYFKQHMLKIKITTTSFRNYCPSHLDWDILGSARHQIASVINSHYFQSTPNNVYHRQVCNELRHASGTLSLELWIQSVNTMSHCHHKGKLFKW